MKPETILKSKKNGFVVWIVRKNDLSGATDRLEFQVNLDFRKRPVPLPLLKNLRE